MASSPHNSTRAAELNDAQTTYVAQDLLELVASGELGAPEPLVPAHPDTEPSPAPEQAPLKLPRLLFTGARDEATGTWEPTPFLRSVYPQGVEGCWLVDSVTPDAPLEER